MTEFPASITEADIKQMSGDKSFERGLKYYQGELYLTACVKAAN